jgi:hypothetical protein
VRVARRVREGTCGKRPAATPAPRPQVYLTHDGVARAAPNGPDELKSVMTARLRRLQRLPQIVRGFFGDPELAYIAATA